jgi:hypothetical protein
MTSTNTVTSIPAQRSKTHMAHSHSLDINSCYLCTNHLTVLTVCEGHMQHIGDIITLEERHTGLPLKITVKCQHNNYLLFSFELIWDKAGQARVLFACPSQYEVMLWAWTWELLGSSLGQGISYDEWRFSWSYSVPQDKFRDISMIKPWSFPSRSLTICPSSAVYHSVLHSLDK